MKDKDTRSTHPAGTHTISDDLKSFDAKIPFWKGIPFGLQHVMAMFVANLTPLILIAGVAKMDTSHKEWLIQGGLLVAGLGTILQLFPCGASAAACLWSPAFPLRIMQQQQQR